MVVSAQKQLRTESVFTLQKLRRYQQLRQDNGNKAINKATTPCAEVFELACIPLPHSINKLKIAEDFDIPNIGEAENFL